MREYRGEKTRVRCACSAAVIINFDPTFPIRCWGCMNEARKIKGWKKATPEQKERRYAQIAADRKKRRFAR